MRDSIYILPLGEIEWEILEEVKKEITAVFQFPVKVLPNLSNPAYAFEPKRGQYYSTKILKELISKLPDDGVKILGITEVDLCTPVLTFVFGEAHLEGCAAVISLARLHQEYYDLPSNKPLLLNRAVKEAIHELGHTFGLVHCRDNQCVMSFSPNCLGIDQKQVGFCSVCQGILARRLSLPRPPAEKSGETSLQGDGPIARCRRTFLLFFLTDGGFVKPRQKPIAASSRKGVQWNES